MRECIFKKTFLAAALLFSGAVAAENTLLVSSTASGVTANGGSDRPAISADGRFVAFQSDATSLISGDGNARMDIFLRDRQLGTTVRISKGLSGAESNADSSVASISGNGRYVAFESTASNLVTGDTNVTKDAFVYDTVAGKTTRVSVSSTGAQADGESFRPQLSYDGRFVVFLSNSTNLIVGDTNGVDDIFLHDRDPDGNGLFDEGNGTTVRASLSVSGTPLLVASNFPSISADGQFVAFTSGNGVFVYDRIGGAVTSAAAVSNGVSTYTSLSADGRYVAFVSAATNLVANDTNGFLDVFVYDRTLATTTLASVSQTGTQQAVDSISPVISSDGRYVAFVTTSTAFARLAKPTVAFDAVSGATGGGGGGGTTATYYVFRRDLLAAKTVRVSSTSGGSLSNGSSGNPGISSDGSYVAFSSTGSNMTCASDSNLAADIFVRDLRSSTTADTCGSTSSTSTKSAGGGLEFLSLLLLSGLAVVRRLGRLS